VRRQVLEPVGGGDGLALLGEVGGSHALDDNHSQFAVVWNVTPHSVSCSASASGKGGVGISGARRYPPGPLLWLCEHVHRRLTSG
jgi:hypothetical protein